MCPEPFNPYFAFILGMCLAVGVMGGVAAVYLRVWQWCRPERSPSGVRFAVTEMLRPWRDEATRRLLRR